MNEKTKEELTPEETCSRRHYESWDLLSARFKESSKRRDEALRQATVPIWEAWKLEVESHNEAHEKVMYAVEIEARIKGE